MNHSKINDDDEVVRLVNVYSVRLLDHATKTFDDKMVIAGSEDEAIETVKTVFNGRLGIGGMTLLGQALERLL